MKQRFNSRTPGGVRPESLGFKGGKVLVSIHAPREGCDLDITPEAVELMGVSIHAPREGCDEACASASDAEEVSIHAPREGCDSSAISASTPTTSFNSRTPGGVRLPSAQ